MIQPYSHQQAERLGVLIRPSANEKKKIDVFKNGKKVASIGAMGYGDFPSFLKTDGKAYAEERRRLYHIRHKKDSSLAGRYARSILW